MQEKALSSRTPEEKKGLNWFGQTVFPKHAHTKKIFFIVSLLMILSVPLGYFLNDRSFTAWSIDCPLADDQPCWNPYYQCQDALGPCDAAFCDEYPLVCSTEVMRPGQSFTKGEPKVFDILWAFCTFVLSAGIALNIGVNEIIKNNKEAGR